MIDNFVMGWEKYQNLLEGFQPSSARPSGRISMEMKIYEKDFRIVTVVA